MWEYIGFAFSLHLLGVFGSRASDLLDNCNWVNDADPDDGTYPGWYAIEGYAPTMYCNERSLLNGDGSPATVGGGPGEGPAWHSMNWWYECDGNDTVVKYMCINADETTSGCDKTDTARCSIRSTITDPSRFNCDMVADSCLMKITQNFNLEAGMTTCAPGDPPTVVTLLYKVNGACENQTDSGDGGESYALLSCNDPLGGPSQGVEFEYYVDENCAFLDRDERDYVDEWSLGECQHYAWDHFLNDRMNQFGEIDCNGYVNATFDHSGGGDGGPPETNGDIDGLEGCDQCEAPCVSAVQSVGPFTLSVCEIFGDMLFGNDIGQCAGTEAMIRNFTTSWCNEISGNGVTCGSEVENFLNCVLTDGCYYVREDDSSGGGGDDSAANDCRMACMGTHSCVPGTGTTAGDDCVFLFTDEASPLEFDCENCPDWSIIRGLCAGTRDCSVFKPTLECMAGCGSDDDGDDGMDCPGLDFAKIIGCEIDADCFRASDAVLGDVFSDENSVCDESLCSPAMFQKRKTDQCTADAASCNAAFDAIFNPFVACLGEECHFKKCGTQIDSCQDDPACNDELEQVVNIEDTFGVGDGAFHQLVKAKMCADIGPDGCKAGLDAAYQCVVDQGCMAGEEPPCWEASCQSEVDACAANPRCFETVLEALKNETDCAMELRYDYMCDCKNLNASQVSMCGEYSMEDYERCAEKCSDCDKWDVIGLRECSAGECGGPSGGAFADLMKCIATECRDEEEGGDDDGCDPAACKGPMIDCMFTPGCNEDFEWVGGNIFGIDLFVYPSTSASPECGAGIINDLMAEMMDPATTATRKVEIQSLYYSCKYKDILAYCQDTGAGGNNPDGCSAEFYLAGNCMMSNCYGVTDTVQPTMAPTQDTSAPTADPTTATPTASPVTAAPVTAAPVAATTDDGGDTDAPTDQPPGEGDASRWNVVPLMALCAILSVVFW